MMIVVVAYLMNDHALKQEAVNIHASQAQKHPFYLLFDMLSILL
jgi:hypothetical protein